MAAFKDHVFARALIDRLRGGLGEWPAGACIGWTPEKAREVEQAAAAALEDLLSGDSLAERARAAEERAAQLEAALADAEAERKSWRTFAVNILRWARDTPGFQKIWASLIPEACAARAPRSEVSHG